MSEGGHCNQNWTYSNFNPLKILPSTGLKDLSLNQLTWRISDALEALSLQLATSFPSPACVPETNLEEYMRILEKGPQLFALLKDTIV